MKHALFRNIGTNIKLAGGLGQGPEMCETHSRKSASSKARNGQVYPNSGESLLDRLVWM